MGTRSLTYVYDGYLNPILAMYRQMDGYPEGHGKELFDFLIDIEIVNGFSSGQKEPFANGLGCLAAQLVAHFKKGPGDIYLQPPSEEDFDNDYTYIISSADDLYEGPAANLSFILYRWGKQIFNGTVKEFFNFKDEE